MGDINLDRLPPLEPALPAQKRQASGENPERRPKRQPSAAVVDEPASAAADAADEEAANFDSFA